MRLTDDQWTIGHLRDHLQYAVSLEFWTIPFYMAAMLSIVDRTSGAFQLVQSIVNQEMLHLQLASNVANAYGLSPTFDPPVYAGQAIPHLNFTIDKPDPRPRFSPFSAEIGPLDSERVNAMCLIEFPKWDQGAKPDLRDDVVDYGSIGAFYDAVEYGASLLKWELEGGVRQVDHFGAFYRDEALLKVLVASFDELRAAMTAMFAGGNPNDFLPVMIKVGARIQTCWKNGLVPRFS